MNLGGPGPSEPDARSESRKAQRRKRPEDRVNEQFDRNQRLNERWFQPRPPMLSEGATAEEIQRYNDWERWMRENGATDQRIKRDYYRLRRLPME